MENVNSVCYVAKIDEIKPIEGADKIVLATIGGWNCVIQKDTYQEGHVVIVATTDAVIPTKISDPIHVTSYLRKGGRVRTVKLRGVYSECLILPINFIPEKYRKEGVDCMELLEIFKYEPPVKMVQLSSGKKVRYQDNPNFTVYYKFPNAKNVPDMFSPEDTIEVTRKIHGTNARYGIVRKKKLSLFDRIRKFFGIEWIDYDFVVGSHNVEKGSDSQGYYDTNVWYEINDKYKIKQKMWSYVKKYHSSETFGSGIILYGEIYGAGIQKGYDYGLKDQEFVGFDVSINGEYLDANKAFSNIALQLDLDYVDVLYMGPYDKEVIEMYFYNSFIKGTKVPHEGVVVKEISGDRRKIAKVINPDYLIYLEKNNIGDSH